MNIFGLGKNEEETPVAPVEEAAAAAEETTEQEEDAAAAGINLMNEAQKYEIPDTFEGHEILSISKFKTVGEQTFAVAYCDDRCTYDVPVTLKQ